MLVLSRKVGEKIVIGENITIVVQRIGKGRVALAIEAPHEVPVLRGELAPYGIQVEPEPQAPARPNPAETRRESVRRASNGRVPERNSSAQDQWTRPDRPAEPASRTAHTYSTR